MNTSKRVEALLQEMTLEEKAAQLTQLNGLFFKEDAQADVTGPLHELGIPREAVEAAGSVLSVFDTESILDIQRRHLENSRLKIPLLFMADVIHGYRTIFPIPLALSCTWDMDVVRQAAQVSAREASAAGQHVTFSPMADVAHDQRWGRVMEGAGEDPLLSALVTEAFVKGYQGDSCGEKGRLAACAKHFIGYGFSESGREYNTVDLSQGVLRDYCLAPYQAAVDAGCEMVMAAFNTIDRVPAAGNEKILNGLLRQELGFTGVSISDWGAVEELVVHSVAQNGREAAKLAMTATLDIEMMSPHYANHLPQLVREGLIPEAQLDAAVRRVLALKEKLGLFENPCKDADPQLAQELFLCPEHRAAARRAARKAPVLLKNENHLLPLGEVPVLVAGPFAQSRAVMGGWSACGRDQDCVSLAQGLEEALGEKVLTAPWAEDQTELSIRRAVHAAQDAQVIVCTLGEPETETGECTSKADLSLPRAQLELLKALRATGKPLVAVVFSGRALELEPVLQADAVLQAWFLGTESGNALADLLLGRAAPSGRLAVSIPRKTGQMPLYYNAYRTGRPKKDDSADTPFVSKYLDCPNAPLFPFGYGLTYTTFRYGSLTLSSDRMAPGEQITASVSLRNTGTRPGEEVVQLYLCDESASVVRPVKELKAFQRVLLAPGAETTVTFSIDEEMLRFWNARGQYRSEPGAFTVYVGPHSQTDASAPFLLTP